MLGGWTTSGIQLSQSSWDLGNSWRNGGSLFFYTWSHKAPERLCDQPPPPCLLLFALSLNGALRGTLQHY